MTSKKSESITRDELFVRLQVIFRDYDGLQWRELDRIAYDLAGRVADALTPEIAAAVEAERKKSITFSELNKFLGETIHTAFRKGCTSNAAGEVHSAISKMPREDWGSALAWMIWALGVSTDREKAANAAIATRSAPAEADKS